MKPVPTLLMSVATTLLLIGCTTPEPGEYAPARYQTIRDTNTDSDDAWVSANLWLAERFMSAEAVIEFSDKDSGVIAGTANSRVTYETPGETDYSQPVNRSFQARYSMIIELRNGRLRVTIADGVIIGDVHARVLGDVYGPNQAFSFPDRAEREALEALMEALVDDLAAYIDTRATETW